MADSFSDMEFYFYVLNQYYEIMPSVKIGLCNDFPGWHRRKNTMEQIKNVALLGFQATISV